MLNQILIGKSRSGVLTFRKPTDPKQGKKKIPISRYTMVKLQDNKNNEKI